MVKYIYSNRVRVRVKVSLNSQLVLEKPISSLVHFKVCLCHVSLCGEVQVGMCDLTLFERVVL